MWRCPWLLICVAVCLLLDYPTYSRQQAGTAIYIEDYPNHPDCNTFGTLGDYFNNEAGKNITCPYFLRSGTTESDPPTSSTNLCPHPPGFLPPPSINVSVSWCYMTGAYDTPGIGTVTLCFNATGDRDVSYSVLETSQLVNHIDNISVLDDGRLLHLPENSFTDILRFSEVSCTVIAESDDQLQQCGVDEFRLTILDRTKTKEDHIPSILSMSRKENLEVNVGEQLRWCVSGRSLGVHDLQWVWSQNPSLETVNITANVSDPPCLNCDCAESAYYNLDIVQRYLHNMSMGGARGVAFSVLGYEDPQIAQIAMFAKSWQCSGVPTNYLSFVIIDEVEPGDSETELMINVTSFTGESMQGDYAIKFNAFSSEGPTTQPPQPPPYHIIVPIIVIVVIVVLLSIILVAYLRYLRLKAEPPRMCPVGSVTASLIASTLAPFGLQPVENSSSEFPRENLQFLKVLGEGQFGRVFKAIAEGICPYDSNRNVVAVKTLKENARPSDKDDLRSELATMRGMEPHPNILNYLGMCSETATEPLCILLEFAMYGSLKDYLKSVRTGKLPNPQLLLRQAQPIAPPPRTSTANHQVTSGNAATVTSGMTSSAYPATNSTLNLCPYHHNQLTQHRQNGTTPYLVSSAISTGGAPINQHQQHHHLCPAASVSLYDADPASKAHSMRLMRLLNSKYYTQQLTDNHERCHGDTQESGQLACSYCGVGEMCVRRACLDDYPYWYHSRNDYYNSYYNYNSKQQKKGDSGSTFAKTSGNVLPPQVPPIYVSACEGEVGANSSSYPQQESVCHCESPPNLNPYVNTDQGEGGANSSSYPQQELVCHCESPPNLNAYINTHQGEGGAKSSSYPQQELVCHCESPPNLNPYYNYNQSPSSGCIYCHHYANSEAGGGAYQQPTGTDRANLGADLGRGGEGVGLNAAAASSDSTGTRLSYFEVLDFALQIARGMEHLDKMKCVHRDLAARNVLIAEGFLLKIGDFGLARDLSEKDYYRKITPGRVPARWMALESLEERTHTSKSDVWSYGVVLWEILTYGGLPYGKSPVASGIESLTAHIKAGHRLPKPPNCSEEMFGLLKMCWEEDPELRPSFTQLVNVFTTLLDSTEEYFSVSVEDAVHQRMTAHLEASAVAGISSSGPEREPLQPTILTSPYGTMGAPPALSTSCSYIDEPDPPSLSPTGGHSVSVPMSPGPSGASNLGPSLLDQVSTALGQDYLKLVDDSVNDHEEQDRSNELDLPLFSAGAASMGNGEPGTGMGFNYLKLVDDSANYHEERDHSNGGSLPLLSAGAANMGNGEPGTRMRVNQTTTTSTTCSDVERTCDTSEERNEQVVHYPPPDIVLESLPSQSTRPLGLNGVARASWDNQISGDGLNGRSKVKLGHSQTRQRNIHCLETEV